jgi:hypothetical protein
MHQETEARQAAMPSRKDDRTTDHDRHDQTADAGRVAAARSVLAAIDTAVFGRRNTPTRAEHRARFGRKVAKLFSDA